MAFLFGHLYDRPCKFTHDQAMFRQKGGSTPVVADPRPASPPARPQDDGSIQYPRVKDMLPLHQGSTDLPSEPRSEFSDQQSRTIDADPARLLSSRLPGISRSETIFSEPHDQPSRKRRRQSSEASHTPYRPSKTWPDEVSHGGSMAVPSSAAVDSDCASSLSPSEYTAAWQQEAFDAALGARSIDWNQIILTSVAGHQELEKEL